MSDLNFWDKVELGAKEAGVKATTFRAWRSRKRISRTGAYKVFEALKDSENSIALDALLKPVLEVQ